MARDHLHVRRLRPQADRRLLLQQGSGDARASGQAAGPGQDARRGLPVSSSRSTAARSRWARRSTRASTAWRGCSRISSARRVPSRWRWSRCGGRGASTARPSAAASGVEDPALARAAGRRAPRPRLAPASPPRRSSSARRGSNSFRASHFFVLASLDGRDGGGHRVAPVDARAPDAREPHDRCRGARRRRFLSHAVAARRRCGHADDRSHSPSAHGRCSSARRC